MPQEDQDAADKASADLKWQFLASRGMAQPLAVPIELDEDLAKAYADNAKVLRKHVMSCEEILLVQVIRLLRAKT